MSSRYKVWFTMSEVETRFLVERANDAIRRLRLAWESHCPNTLHHVKSRPAYKEAQVVEHELDQFLKKFDK